MGIAIQTYRARIGTFKNFRCGDSIGKYRHSRGSDVAALVPNINVSSDLKTVGCVIFIGVLLMISGVEPNPGPMENGSDSCQIDEVPGLVKRKETIADGSNTLPEQPNKIKLTKLSVDMNKILLKTFLEEAITCDGRVVEVKVNSRELSAIVTFDTTAAVNEIMNKRPLTLYGFNLDVDVCRDKVDSEYGHTERRVQGADSLQTTGDKVDWKSGPTERRVQGAESLQTTGTIHIPIAETEPDSLHENDELKGGILNECVPKNRTRDKDPSSTPTTTGHRDIQPKRWHRKPFEKGKHTNLQEHSYESQEMKKIQITKLPGHVNPDMLIQYFESKITYFGKVVDVTINSEKHFAIVEFNECAAVYKVMDKMPLTMFGSKVDICVYENGTIFKEDNCYDEWRIWKWKRKFLNFFGGKSETSEPRMNKYKSELEKNGLTGLKGLLSKDLESLTSTKVHIAVTGASGAGKSSFINSIRGLTPEDPGAAEVGANETTSTCNRYEHPENKSFVVWDLPGVGTPNFPEKTYLEMVGYDQYDFFIIISKDRFTELDLWLAKAVRQRNKSCFFVRSNIDATIENNARDFKKTHNEKILLQTIQSHIQKEFQSKGFRDQKVFLISNCELNKYDFGKLNNELLSSSDGLKRDTLALSLSAVTREVIEEKKRVLKSRISETALSIASESTKSEQKKIFQDEINFYQRQFNIDQETLSENKEILFLTDDNLRHFRVLFDESQQDGIISMKTPTASMNDVSALIRFVDSFAWSKDKTLLYGFSKRALEINLDFLYHKTITFYDTAKFSSLVKKTTT